MKQNKQDDEIPAIKKGNIYYLPDSNGKVKKYKPWLGDIFSFLYDKIMEKSIFPKKFNGNIQEHHKILKTIFKNIHNSNILEIATGSGNAALFLNNDNTYSGIDISPGLLQKANRRFQGYGFREIKLYNASADELPFLDTVFDYAVCNLSLNFFDDIELFIKELRRVLKDGSTFFCSVPVPERKLPDSKIRGTLYSENELVAFFKKYNFNFKSMSYRNGALLYFSAILNEK